MRTDWIAALMESWSGFREGRVETITTSRGLGAVILTNQGLYVCEGAIKAHAEKHTPICAHTSMRPYKYMPYMPIQVYAHTVYAHTSLCPYSICPYMYMPIQYMPIHICAHIRTHIICTRKWCNELYCKTKMV